MNLPAMQKIMLLCHYPIEVEKLTGLTDEIIEFQPLKEQLTLKCLNVVPMEGQSKSRKDF
jgi:hypothetical protein